MIPSYLDKRQFNYRSHRDQQHLEPNGPNNILQRKLLESNERVWVCHLTSLLNHIISMAPTLASNSFLLTTTPQSRLTTTTFKNPGLTMFAKTSSGPFSPFQFGKAKDNPEEGQPEDSGNSSPFRFDFGKAPEVKTLVPVASKPATGLGYENSRRKDSNTVFVAGATGHAGIRIAQTLLRQGFAVRAGAPELAAAQELAFLAAKYKIISNKESKRLKAVESTVQDAESIAKAIGNFVE